MKDSVAVEIQEEPHNGSILLGGGVCRIITEAEYLRELLDQANKRIAELENQIKQ